MGPRGSHGSAHRCGLCLWGRGGCGVGGQMPFFWGWGGGDLIPPPILAQPYLFRPPAAAALCAPHPGTAPLGGGQRQRDMGGGAGWGGGRYGVGGPYGGIWGESDVG